MICGQNILFTAPSVATLFSSCFPFPVFFFLVGHSLFFILMGKGFAIKWGFWNYFEGSKGAQWNKSFLEISCLTACNESTCTILYCPIASGWWHFLGNSNYRRTVITSAHQSLLWVIWIIFWTCACKLWLAQIASCKLALFKLHGILCFFLWTVSNIIMLLLV